MTKFGPGFIFGGIGGNDAFTKSLLHLEDAALADVNAGGSAKVWTQHGGGFAAGQFGNAFSGAGVGYIDTPNAADFTLGILDWTIDFWIDVTAGYGTTRYVAAQMDVSGTTYSFAVVLIPANTISMQIGGVANVGSVTAITAAGWHHFAVSRSGSTFRCFLDGLLQSSATSAAAVNAMTTPVTIGRGGSFPTNIFTGLIDEFRLSVGIARWTANFTPPAAPYS